MRDAKFENPNVLVVPVLVITAKCDLRHKEAARRCVTSSTLWLPAARPLSAPEYVS